LCHFFAIYELVIASVSEAIHFLWIATLLAQLAMTTNNQITIPASAKPFARNKGGFLLPFFCALRFLLPPCGGAAEPKAMRGGFIIK
jgi:hypothetical protein